MKIELSSRYLFVVLVALLLGRSVAAEPYLVRDFAPGSAPFDAYVALYNAHAGAAVYFVASDPAHGQELWRSDGTPDGTFRLTDICPGPCDGGAGEIKVFGGQIYFSADDGVSGRELWATADRPGTSRRVRDICPGPCSGQPEHLEVAGDRLFFEAGLGERGLWKTDGTRQGTVLVKNLCTTDCIYNAIYHVGDLVLFQWNDSRIPMWYSDGTAAGTGPFSDIVPDIPTFVEFYPVGDGTAFLIADDAIWWTDGTAAGTRRLRTKAELGITSTDSLIYWSRGTIWKGMLILVGSGFSGGDLVRSDGTPEGTLLIGKIPAGANLIGFAPLDDALLFALQSPDVLWRTEGTPETTGQVMELPGYIYDLGPFHGGAGLCLFNSENAGALWFTDGTAAGTRRAEAAVDGCGFDSVPIGDRLVFLGNTRELWSTDGTTAGTTFLHDFGELPAASGPLDQIGFRGKLLFSARISETEAPLFSSDGTPGGTQKISDEAGWAYDLAVAGDRVFFGAFERYYQDGYLYGRSLGLWKTNGTAAGTAQVDPEIGSYRSPMVVGKTLFFSAANLYSYYGDPDLELFRSDGTEAGTGLVRNIDRFSADTGHHHICYDEPSSPGPGIALNGRLIFVANDGQRGRELWASNGTRTGTVLVRDIDPRRLDGAPPGSCDDNRQRTGVGSDPRDFIRFHDGVLFTATDGDAGRELWWTDGTAGGTRRVRDLRPGVNGAEPHDLVLFQGRVWFVASSQGAGEELWRTDGTAQGTVRVRRLAFQGVPAWAHGLTVAGGKLFFVLSNPETGPELWMTPNAGVARRVADLHPGPEGSYPQSFTVAGDLLVFAADDGTHGLEPWQSDGTAAGTRLVGDIRPGLDASSPGPFTPVAGGLVLTGADDGEHGRELWALPVEDP